MSAICWSGRLVELAVDLEPVDLERRPGRAADADGVDPDAAVGGGLGGVQRVGLLVVLAVGQQDDRGRGVRPAGTGVGVGVGSGERFV